MAAGLTPKPAEAAYEAFFARYGIDPQVGGDVRGRGEEPRRPEGARHDDRSGDAEAGAERPPPAARPRRPRQRGELADVVTDDLGGFLARLNDLLA